LGGFAHTVPVSTQRARAQLRHAEIEQAHQAQLVALSELGLPEGMAIRVDGERGVFLVRGMGTDGSITCVGGESGHWRSFRPEWCYPATRPPGSTGAAVRWPTPCRSRNAVCARSGCASGAWAVISTW